MDTTTYSYAQKHGIEDPQRNIFQFIRGAEKILTTFQVQSSAITAGAYFRSDVGLEGPSYMINGLDVQQAHFHVTGYNMLDVLVALRQELDSRETRRLQARSAYLLSQM